MSTALFLSILYQSEALNQKYFLWILFESELFFQASIAYQFMKGLNKICFFQNYKKKSRLKDLDTKFRSFLELLSLNNI